MKLGNMRELRRRSATRTAGESRASDRSHDRPLALIERILS